MCLHFDWWVTPTVRGVVVLVVLFVGEFSRFLVLRASMLSFVPLNLRRCVCLSPPGLMTALPPHHTCRSSSRQEQAGDRPYPIRPNSHRPHRHTSCRRQTTSNSSLRSSNNRRNTTSVVGTKASRHKEALFRSREGPTPPHPLPLLLHTPSATCLHLRLAWTALEAVGQAWNSAGTAAAAAAAVLGDGRGATGAPEEEEAGQEVAWVVPSCGTTITER